MRKNGPKTTRIWDSVGLESLYWQFPAEYSIRTSMIWYLTVKFHLWCHRSLRSETLGPNIEKNLKMAEHKDFRPPETLIYHFGTIFTIGTHNLINKWSVPPQMIFSSYIPNYTPSIQSLMESNLIFCL